MVLYQKQIMLVRDKFLKKISRVFLILVIFFSKNLYANNAEIINLIDYNSSLKNSTALFIQSDGKTVEEGIIYVGLDRIRIEYTTPSKITIIISKNKGMYVNHALEETQYFDTKKSFVKVFFSILAGGDFYKEADIKIFDDEINIKNKFELDNIFYRTEVIYENEPIRLRKIKIVNNDTIIELGFFDHNNLVDLEKEFFSFINPYLN